MKKYLKEQKKKRKRIGRTIAILLGILIVVALVVGFWLYKRLMTPNVALANEEKFYLYIPTGSTFEQVKDSLYTHHLIINEKSFEWVAAKKKYPENIKAGRYAITRGLGNLSLVNMLQSGNQKPVNVTFNNMRTIPQLAGRISTQIEADSASIVNYIAFSDSIRLWGFNARTVPAMFLPNTYEFYWNTDAEKFVMKMKKEYDKFWNQDRLDKAKAAGLTPIEVSILASIVDKETNMSDEMPRIAGVYLNRLNSGWLLQADPTLVFALGDFSLKRVLNVHKEVESPYNTYKYPGLPPGPICIPSLAAINAVLDAEKHNYFYFCAKEDFSGYHNFAKTLSEHNKNAMRYQKALDKLNH